MRIVIRLTMLMISCGAALAVVAERAHQSGFSALVVLGGDRSIGAPRSVAHAWQLREPV